ncbi:uncharacterized protein ATNIH1004_001957 [Aspergillus tanneri]|uniref:Uncharacterized protein n=1 Tax=Aspergillus tanneri TaxID=1220188 RepID=A0A5M9M2Z9_9EURO|nr:uncharacterized protein ATNIH1004_001957 [Aspergillus tanneri]KAA8641355.1 hypothetical protein ATNIH1004_001957 [Aspergillus tanneri]
MVAKAFYCICTAANSGERRSMPPFIVYHHVSSTASRVGMTLQPTRQGSTLSAFSDSSTIIGFRLYRWLPDAENEPICQYGGKVHFTHSANLSRLFGPVSRSTSCDGGVFDARFDWVAGVEIPVRRNIQTG